MQASWLSASPQPHPPGSGRTPAPRAMAIPAADGAAALQRLAAYLQADPPSAPRTGTPDSIADRLDELAHANAKAVGQAFLMMNELAQTATSLLQFAAELSACTRARVPAAGPAEGMPAAAAGAVLQPPPAEVAPAADASATARAARSRPRGRAALPARRGPAPAPPAAAVPAAAPVAAPLAEAAAEEFCSSSDSSVESSGRRPHRGAAATAAAPRTVSPPGMARARSAGPGAGAVVGALRPGSPANGRPRPVSPPAAAANFPGEPHIGRPGRPDADHRHPAAWGAIGAWPTRDQRGRDPRPNRRAIVGGPAATAAPRHRSRSRGRRPRR